MIFIDFFMKNLYFIVIFWGFFFSDFVLGFTNAWKRKEISSTEKYHMYVMVHTDTKELT